MEDQGRHIAFLSGGCLSKASYNKLNNYREKLAKNYDAEQKKEIKRFIADLNKGKFEQQRFEKIMNVLHLIKNPVDEFDYKNFNLVQFQKFNLLQQFIQRNMYSIRLLKQLSKGKDICYTKIGETNPKNL